ncbi:hypothetical protein MMC07_008189 [Pseudocyphellaria aurata]|nr:hypothetical protein [Pseudocyphellaria aurata]
MAGREIFRNRKQLRAFNNTCDYPLDIENPFNGYKTTEVNITSEAFPASHEDLVTRTVDTKVAGKTPSGRGYDRYTVTIGSAPLGPETTMPQTPSGATMFYRKNKAAMEANTAAWGYTKCALLFFVSLLITWVSRVCMLCVVIVGRSWDNQADVGNQVPSSINRVYSLAHPDLISVPFTYASGVVLPLMGFWNSVIYITTSWTPCKMLFKSIFSDVSRQKSALPTGRSRSIVEQRSGTGTKRSNESVSESVKGLASSSAG